MGGLERRCDSLACDNQVMTLALAARGVGVALAHRRLLAERDDLVVPFDPGLPCAERFWLVRPSRREVGDDAGRVWRWLLAERELSGG